jgi:plastocyanin
MRPVVWIAAAMAMACAVARAQNIPATRPADTGTVRGKVSIKGGSLFQKPDLSRVVVYLSSSPDLDKKAGPTTQAVVAQKNKAFTPNFVIVPVGTEVEFPNWDTFDHNVFSKSAAAPAFDLDRYPYGQSKKQTFGKLGVVQVFCNIHPEMRAVIYVTPNSYFTRADKDGNFEITGLPSGSFEVIAWNERCEEQHQTVQIQPARPSEITFTLQESRQRVLSTGEDRRGGYGVERGLGVKQEKLDLPVNQDVHPAPPESKP